MDMRSHGRERDRTMLYAIGDEGADIESQFELFSTFQNIVHVTFDELMSTEKIIDGDAGIILFFPYKLWNAFVETGHGLYGGKSFRKNICKLKDHLCKKLTQVFPEALYVNELYVFALERDKLVTKSLLSRHGISVIPNLPRDIVTIKKELARGHCVYVKARYGSMGKGITRLEQGRWLTNFRYDNGKIENHPSDFEWRSIEVTGDGSFLEKLLVEDVVVERGVETPRELGSKFDIRGVFVYGRLAELYGRASDNPLITNLSQGGGCLEPGELVERLGADRLTEATKHMYEANRVFKTNFLGVDLAFDKNLTPYVMEVNSFPGLGHGVDEEDIRDALLRDVYSNLKGAHTRKEIMKIGRMERSKRGPASVAQPF